MPEEIDWNGGRYWQGQGINPDCGADCDLESTVTHTKLDASAFGSGVRQTIQGLADETVYCPLHGVTWYRSG